MTLTHAIVVTLLVTLPVIVFVAYGKYTEAQLRRITSYEKWSDRFFYLTKHALQHDLPKEWIEMLALANECIADNGAAMGVYVTYSRRLKNPSESSSEAPANEVEFVKKNMDATKLFLDACRAGFMAMTYTSLFWGVKARSVYAEYLADIAGDKKAAAEVREMEDIGRQFHQLGHSTHKLLPAAA